MTLFSWKLHIESKYSFQFVRLDHFKAVGEYLEDCTINIIELVSWKSRITN